MDESDDILTRPLGLAKPAAKGRLPAIRVPGRVVAASAAALVLLAAGALVLFGDPEGGEPHATVAITIREPERPAPAEATAQAATADEALKRSAEQVEQASGVTVTRPVGAKAPEVAVIIGVPATDAPRLAPAPDPRLTERGRHGPLPRIGEGRVRPLDIYARTDSSGSASARIAILVTGIGVGDSATAAAITRLPPAISLAVTPYGQEADKTAARARLAGHEILLQLPMEPFDYPDSDPGPQTLLTGSRGPENLDRLHWAMSRFPGFVGLVNFMGGKLTSDPAAFEPVLREIGQRGLGYVEDGSAARSVAASLAPKLKTPFARAETMIDALARPEAIDKELAKLEAQARAKGFVLASATASPMTIDRIARWSSDLEARGIALVPVSAALRGAAATRLSSAER